MIRKGYTFDDVTIVPAYSDISSRKEVDISVKMGPVQLKVPILSANMDTITGSKMAITLAQMGAFGVLHRFMSIEDNVTEFGLTRGYEVGVSIGVNEELRRFNALFDAGARIFILDVAHGHSKKMGQLIKDIRRDKGDIVYLIAGNVASYAGADYLASCGADAIKVGIGAGSVCQTRIKTGCGVPQLTNIIDCARVDRFIIADGGIKTSGDCVKAIAAGADAVMVGSMLSGTEETPGDIHTGYKNISEAASGLASGTSYKMFRGSASREAQEDFMGEMSEWKTSEGVEVKVPFKGSVRDVVADIAGGLRSGLSYCGARNIEALQRKAEFMEVTAAGYYEGTPHLEKKL